MTHCRIRPSLTSEGNWIMHAMIKKYIHCELNFHARCLPSIGLVLFKLVDIQRQLDKGRHRRSKQLIAITVQPKTACTSSLKDTRSAEDQCEQRILLFLRHNIIAFNSYRNQRSIPNMNSHAVNYERMLVWSKLCSSSAIICTPDWSRRHDGLSNYVSYTNQLSIPNLNSTRIAIDLHCIHQLYAQINGPYEIWIMQDVRNDLHIGLHQ